MHDDLRIKVRELFADALERPAEERAAFLDAACADDDRVRPEVDRLLRAAHEASISLAAPGASGSNSGNAPGNPPGSADTVLADPALRAGDQQPGEMIGRYKLLEPLGEGGFGSVWMAEQRHPVKRRVALKIIKLGMDTKQVIARFEAERQALAMMDHPNIAKVLDAGATESGRPYFVMELVRGIPILEFCDAQTLDTRRRLALFVQVCNAIQHAHQKGIIHRDIKPSNVLITLHDGKPVVKVIDFGIAKATNAELTEKTLFTQHRQMIGTPAYMSPEQAEMSGLDIDTRSDVYSLGVLLYELLTGTTPFDAQTLLSRGFAEMMRVIREVEPHRPSTRLSTLGASRARTAKLRGAEEKKLDLLLRGDLDWIAMKCLEKDRSRRYDTANALALDVQRHLDGDPVIAAPPSRAYRLRKFVRRNRGQVLAAAVVGAALILGIAGTSVGMVRAIAAQRQQVLLREDAVRARDAEAAQREAAELAAASEARARHEAEAAQEAEAALRVIAERETEGSRVITAFLTRVVSLGNPADTGRPDLTVRELLVGAEDEIAGALHGHPRAEGRVRLAIGRAYLGLSEIERAQQMLRSASRLLNAHDPDNHWDRYEAHARLSYADAQLNLSSGMDVVPALHVGAEIVGASFPQTAARMRDMLEGLATRQISRIFAGAEQVRVQAPLEIPPDDPAWEPAAHMIWLAGAVAMQLNRAELAADYMQTVHAWTEDQSSIHPLTRASWQLDFGESLARAGRSDEAEAVFHRTLERFEGTLHADHMFLAVVRGARGRNLLAMGRDAEARVLLRAACDYMLRTSAFVFDGARVFVSTIELAERVGDGDDAAELRAGFARIISTDRDTVSWTMARQALGPDSAALRTAAEALRIAMRRPEDREALTAQYDEFLTLWHAARTTAPHASALIAHYVNSWSRSSARLPRDVRRRICGDALEALEDAGAMHGRGIIGVFRELFAHAVYDGAYEQAHDHARRAWALSRELWGSQFRESLFAQREVGVALMLLGRFEEAEPLLVPVFHRLREQDGDSQETHTALRTVLWMYQHAGRLDEAAKFLPAAAEMLFGQVEHVRTLEQGAHVPAPAGFGAALTQHVNPALSAAIAALSRSIETGSPDGAQRAEAVRTARRERGPHDSDPAALAYVSQILHWSRELLDSGFANESVIPLLEDANAVLSAHVGELAWFSIYARRQLIQLLTATGRLDQAEAMAREHLRVISDAFGSESVTTDVALSLLARAHLARGAFDEAQQTLMQFYPRHLAGGFLTDRAHEGFQMFCAIAGEPGRAQSVLGLLGESLDRVDRAGWELRRDYAWYVARQPGLPAELYARALALTETMPDDAHADPLALRSRAAAQFRSGAFEESAANMTEYLRLAEMQPRSVTAAGRLILAIAHRELGDAPRCEDQLALARTLIARGQRLDGEPALLAEAAAQCGF